MFLNYSIKDFDNVIRFGKRIFRTKSELTEEQWQIFCKANFGECCIDIPKLALIGEHEWIAKEIFRRQPTLSINGLCKEIQSEISSVRLQFLLLEKFPCNGKDDI